MSRASPKDSRNHHVLGVQQFKPAEFAQQMNLNMDNAWGILRCILDIVKKLDDGKYLIMKDPNKVNLSFSNKYMTIKWHYYYWLFHYKIIGYKGFRHMSYKNPSFKVVFIDRILCCKVILYFTYLCIFIAKQFNLCTRCKIIIGICSSFA